MNFKVSRITEGPKHHLFGFHDLVCTNAKGDLALALEVNDISHPPLPGEYCMSGLIDLITNSCSSTPKFTPLHKCHTWNYPQGARQQWLGDSDICLCNDRAEDGSLVCRMYDARKGEEVKTLPFPMHCLNAAENKAVFINYDRLHAVGGYGYVPFNGKNVKLDDLPTDDGLWLGAIKTGEKKLIASILQVASCGETKARRTGFPHYVTHPMLSPSGKRVAFLHRYRIPDGGETTRLMTVGIDGSNLRCMAKGFLSHFTWVSEDEVFIWGAHLPRQFAMREASYLKIPGVIQLATTAKECLKFVRNLGKSPRSTAPVTQSKYFLKIKDCDSPVIEKMAAGVIIEDGHPMARPGCLNQMISDTYPDAAGDRQLYFYDLSTNERIEIGTYRRLFKVPDTSTFDVEKVKAGSDPRVSKRFDIDLYLFARSGFHCDLHPRWSYDGKTAFFDSIHEGTRQIYKVEVVK